MFKWTVKLFETTYYTAGYLVGRVFSDWETTSEDTDVWGNFKVDREILI